MSKLGQKSNGSTLRTVSIAAAVVALALALVGLVFPSNQPRQVMLASSSKSDFPLKPVTEKMAANGKPCWACPCCSGCEETGEAKAADCGFPKAAMADPSSNEDPALSPKQQDLVRTLVDSELEARGLKPFPGNALAWRVYRSVEAINMTKNDTRQHGDMDAAEEHHMYKHLANEVVEDVLQPTGKDWFEKPGHRNKYGKLDRYEAWQDPSGIWTENPVHQYPWHFSESHHWDRSSPESREQGWDVAKGKMLQKGQMTHGTHKTWAELPDAQWGWEHQFANWDPDGDDNNALVWGSGGRARTGLKGDPTSGPLSDTDGNPWEFSWVGGPTLYGDDFVPKDKIFPRYTNPINNQFHDWDEEGDKNQRLVFGEDHSYLNQRSHIPVKDNWDMLMDSKVKPDTVRGEIARRGADVSLSMQGTKSPSLYQDFSSSATLRGK